LDEDLDDVLEDAIFAEPPIGAMVEPEAAGAMAELVAAGVEVVFLDFLTLAGLAGAVVEDGAMVLWAKAGAVMLRANKAARTGSARRMILIDVI
jgi:hypothetical protein